LPLVSARHAAFLHNEVPGVDIPEAIQRRILAAGENTSQEGVCIAVELGERMRPWAGGIYLMPAFNRYDLAAEVVEQVRRGGNT
jgi:homocysteine S-methyltransferase